MNCRFRSPRKGSSASTCGQTSEGKDTLNLLTDGASWSPLNRDAEPRPRTSTGDGTCPAGRPEEVETTTTVRRATPAMRCPRLPNAHPPDRRGAPRFAGRTRQHGVCCRWGHRQGPTQHLAPYALSARTCYGLRGPVVSRQGVPDFNAETSGLRHGPHRLRVLSELVTLLAALQLDVALHTVHRHVHATLRLLQVSEEDVGEATVVEDVPDPAGSHGTGTDVFAHEPRTGRREKHPVLPVDSQATAARQPPDGASEKLGRSRQVVCRASTTEEVTLMKGHHGAQLLGATAHETPFEPVAAHQVHVQTPLAVLQLQPRAEQPADSVTEAVRALGQAELHTEKGIPFLKKLSQGACATELMVDILLAGVPRIARHCTLVSVLQLAYGRLPY